MAANGHPYFDFLQLICWLYTAHSQVNLRLQAFQEHSDKSLPYSRKLCQSLFLNI